MGMNKADVSNQWQLRRSMTNLDDFLIYTSATTGWTTVTAGSGTAAVSDGVGGILTLSAIDSTIDREVYVKQTTQLFLYRVNSPIMVEAFIQYTEQNTNQACMAFGLMSGVTTASMQNVASLNEPKTSFSGAVIYKVAGGTKWKTCSSISTTQNTNTSDTTAGGSAYQRLLIEIMPISSTIAEVTYYVDGVQLKTASGRPGQTKIKDQVTYTGAAAMQLFVCCKNGSTTPEILNVDYIAWSMLRARFT